MIVNARATGRWGFKCTCCQPARKHRDAERRTLKRRERREVMKDLDKN